MKLFVTGIILCLNVYIAAQSTSCGQEWTWLFKKNINATSCAQSEVIFSKIDTPLFDHVVCSWNALRPEQGFFSLYIQVRDATTKKWHVWHKMFDWGKNIQRSHLTRSDVGSSYHYVRLELPKHIPADGLRVRIEAHKTAQMKDMKGLFLSVSRMKNFPEGVIATQEYELPSVQIKGVPQYSQMSLDHDDKGSMCSPTSLCMAISHMLNKKLDPIDFARNVFDAGLGVYGSWPFNVAHGFELGQDSFFCYVRRLSHFTALHRLLVAGIPVVVSVRGLLPGAPKEYTNGHLLLVVGWHKERGTVLCHDPACQGHGNVAIEYKLKDFMRAWDKSRRLAYCCQPNDIA